MGCCCLENTGYDLSCEWGYFLYLFLLLLTCVWLYTGDAHGIIFGLQVLDSTDSLSVPREFAQVLVYNIQFQ